MSASQLQIQPSTAGRRRRFTTEQRQALLAEAAKPGSSISEVSRRYGVAASLLFLWRQSMDEGGKKGLESGEAVVPASVVKQLEAQIRELQRILGKKTQQVEILEEALKIAREKKLLSGDSSYTKGGGR
jgi:transposase